MSFRRSVLNAVRSGSPVLGGVVCAALVMTFLGTVAPTASAGPATGTAATATKSAPVTSRPDIPSARVAAKAQGSRVEALSERSETSTTYVNPDGSLDTELALGPVRVRQSDGSWADVDLALAADGSGVIGPKVSPVPFAVGRAGSSTAASAVFAAAVAEVGWTSALPSPVLTGQSATYPEVRTGVDLVVRSLCRASRFLAGLLGQS